MSRREIVDDAFDTLELALIRDDIRRGVRALAQLAMDQRAVAVHEHLDRWLWVPETRFGAVTCWFRDRPIPGSR